MSIEHMLAKLTPNTPSLMPGSGGIPELTSADIALGLGMAAAAEHGKKLGGYLVLAKLADNDVSKKRLLQPELLPTESLLIWLNLNSKTKPNRERLNALTEIALYDFCLPAVVQRRGHKAIWKHLQMGHDMWRTRYQGVYNGLLNRMDWLEKAVIDDFMRAMRKN